MAQRVVDLERYVQVAAERIDGLVENQARLVSTVESLLWLRNVSWAVNVGAVVTVMLFAKSDKRMKL